MRNKVKSITLFQSLRESFVPSLRFGTKKASSSILLARLSRFINKNFYSYGLGASLNRYDNSFTLYSAKHDLALYESYKSDDIFCNFGSGAFFHNKWQNYDYPGQSEYYKGLQGKNGIDFRSIDLCDDELVIPHSNNSVSLIYCAHTLEHLDSDSARLFLEECFRILQEDGIMRIAIPATDNDFRIAKFISLQHSIAEDIKRNVCAQAARHALTDFNLVDDEKIEHTMKEAGFSAEHFCSKATKEGMNNKFLPENPERHISFWNYAKLISISKDLGFNACIPCYRGSSLANPFLNLNVFDNTEPQNSLYIELVK